MMNDVASVADQDCVGPDSDTAACNAPGGCSVNCSWEVTFANCLVEEF